MIRPVTLNDAESITRIYNHYVENTIVSFEETPVSERAMQSRMREGISDYPWIVAEESDQIVGYAYASRWKSRCSYRSSAECSVYLDCDFTGRGFGSQLFRVLLDELRAKSLHCVIGGIALPNEASVALHEKFGFQKVAHFREVGRKMDRWIDVGYWELLL